MSLLHSFVFLLDLARVSLVGLRLPSKHVKSGLLFISVVRQLFINTLGTLETFPLDHPSLFSLE